MKHSKAAVGILYFLNSFFINAFDPSSWAALPLGPNALIFSASKASTKPRTRGTSGPITTKSMVFFFANVTIAETSLSRISTHSAMSAMPALPGAQ